MSEINVHQQLLWVVVVLSLAGPVFGSSGPKYPLERAAYEGDLELTKNLLAEGQGQYRRDSALEFAIQAGHRDVMELLISHGARYALVKAAVKGDVELVKYLLARKQEAKDCDSAFHAAVRMQHQPIAELLLAHGADINVRRFFGLTPLCLAVTGERDTNLLSRWPNETTSRQTGNARNSPAAEEMVEFLIQHGADVNAKGESPGLVPLHYAIRGGNAKIVETLLTHGAQANPEIQMLWLPSHFATPLHLAAEYGDLALCELLIRHGAKVNVPLPTGSRSSARYTHRTPLHHAAESGNVKVVELLLDHGADVNGADSGGETPLHDAIWRKERVVELLLARGAAVNVASDRGWTPLHYAAQYKDQAAVELLLARGAEADAKDGQGQTPISIAIGNGSDEIVRLLTAQGGRATLHSAASMGDIKALAALVDSGVNINRIDVEGRTALHGAVRAGQVPAVEWLLAHGADANCPDDRDLRPLSIALRIAQDFSFSRDPNKVARFNALKQKQRPIMTLLIGHGAAPDFRYGIPQETVRANPAQMTDLLIEAGVNFEPHRDSQATLLHRAAWWGKTEVVAELLELGADVNAVDYVGATPLHAATQSGSMGYWDVVSGPHVDVLELLLAHGARVNATNNAGATALHGAASYGDPNAVALLIAHGADVNARNDANRTPLHEAAEDGAIDVMALLIAKGADPNVADNEGNTPLLLLLGHQFIWDRDKSRTKDYVIKLVQEGVRGDMQNNQGVAPLQHAATLGLADLMEKLLAQGAPVNAASTSGWTALHSAVAMAHIDCVDLLLKHGAQVNGPGQPPGTINLREHSWGKGTRTPLQIAAAQGEDDIVRLLIAAGADINSTGSDPKTPLYLALDRKHQMTVRLLLGHGADSNSRDPDGVALVYRAAGKDRANMVDTLLQHGARADTTLVQTLLETGTTPLHTAAQDVDLDRVAELLADGVEVNVPDRRGSRPIHYAHAEGHLEIVKLLLPKTPPSVLTSLLFQETKGNANEMIALLISQGADAGAIDLRRGDSLLHRSAWGGDRDMIELLLAHGADVNVLSRSGETPLVVAVRRGHPDTVALLLSHGADVNIAPTGQAYNSGCTPLYSALSQDNVETAEMLVKAGSNLDVRPRLQDVTLLHMALGHRALFELMLAHGGQIDSRLRNGATSLHLVAERGDTDLVQYLIDKGASINVQDNSGNTPLHRAVRMGHGAVCRTLVSNKADITIRNKQGRLPLDYAIASDLKEIIPLLKPDTH